MVLLEGNQIKEPKRKLWICKDCKFVMVYRQKPTSCGRCCSPEINEVLQ